MKFGEPTLDRTVTSDGYMVGGVIMAPPGKIGLRCDILALQHFWLDLFVFTSKLPAFPSSAYLHTLAGVFATPPYGRGYSSF